MAAMQRVNTVSGPLTFILMNNNDPTSIIAEDANENVPSL